MSRFALLLIVCVFLATEISVADVRSWTGSRNWQFKAECLSFRNDAVRVRRSSGNLQSIPLWNLSQTDQNSVARGKGYTVLKAYRQAGVKASLDVRLTERVTRESLIAIAQELRRVRKNQEPRLFIAYYLPGMEVDAGAWATTHFTPRLEVRILGMTKEGYERVVENSQASPSENIIGRWIKTIGIPGVVTFLEENGKTYVIQQFTDGGKGKYELDVYTIQGETRYKKKASKTDDYDIILPNGDLGHCDDLGMLATSKKMK